VSGVYFAVTFRMDRRALPRPQHVLIADDSEDLRTLWKAFLTFWGFTVDEARNGREAVQRARIRKPDLIIMDCWMPILDGFSATSELKEDPVFADVPVLAVSAAHLAGMAARAEEAGSTAFMPKPLMPDQLIAELRVLLRDKAERQKGPSV